MKAARCLCRDVFPKEGSTTFSPRGIATINVGCPRTSLRTARWWTPDALKAAGLVKNTCDGVKVLGNGAAGEEADGQSGRFLRIGQGEDRGGGREGRGDLTCFRFCETHGRSRICVKRFCTPCLSSSIFRIGSAITVPFIDVDAAGADDAVTSSNTASMSYLTLLSGGGFSNASIFALSITPYINASIIIQLLTVAIPPLERMAKDGEAGPEKAGPDYPVHHRGAGPDAGYRLLLHGDATSTAPWPPRPKRAAAASGSALSSSSCCFTAGSALMMWLGEQINEKGIGNGISILLFAGIISRIPTGVDNRCGSCFYDGGIKRTWQRGVKNVILVPVVLVLFLAHDRASSFS